MKTIKNYYQIAEDDKRMLEKAFNDGYVFNMICANT